jgi:isopentenyl-diphosphate Delta-isomerase
VANSCCGHPRPGERTSRAARRRLEEELGTASALDFGFFARYQAGLDHGMQENELVYVYFGRLNGMLAPDPGEIAEIALLSFGEIVRRIKRDPAAFTFWLKHYFHAHGTDIARLTKQVTA